MSKDLGSVRLLDNLNFQIDRGRVLGILGVHGVSKTTLLRVIAGLAPITTGRVRVNGLSVAEAEARADIGYMPRRFGTYPRTTVWEFLDFFGAAFGVPAQTRGSVIEGVLKLIDLTELRDEPAYELRDMELLRLAFGRILIHNPSLLLLDEPLGAFGAEGFEQFRAVVRELSDMGKTVIFTCLDPDVLPDLADEAAVLHRGRFVDFGPVEEVVENVHRHGWPPPKVEPQAHFGFQQRSATAPAAQILPSEPRPDEEELPKAVVDGLRDKARDDLPVAQVLRSDEDEPVKGHWPESSPSRPAPQDHRADPAGTDDPQPKSSGPADGEEG
jgi:ABC-type multidrug transport system ATPase subunit